MRYASVADAHITGTHEHSDTKTYQNVPLAVINLAHTSMPGSILTALKAELVEIVSLYGCWCLFRLVNTLHAFRTLVASSVQRHLELA